VASLVRKEGSKYWFVAYRDDKGRQHRKSTRTTDRKKAERIARDFGPLAQRKIPPHKVRETVLAMIREVYGDDVPYATVRGFTQDWLKTKAPEVAKSTLQSYEKSSAKFLDYLGPAADDDIANIRKTAISGFRNQVHAELSPATVNADLRLVKAVFRAAKRDGYVQDDPAEFVDTVRQQKSGVRRPFTIPELRSIVEAADDEWSSLIRFGLYTGKRIGDLAALTWSNIDLQRGTLRFVTKKTNKVTVIPIADPLMGHLMSLQASDNPRAPLHPRSFGRPVNQLSNEFIDLLVGVGLRQPIVRKKTGRGRTGRRKPSELSFHSLRHTAVSLLKDAGIPDAIVMALVGHDVVRQSDHYTHVGLEAMQKATAALPTL
jgi:integrase